MHRSQHRRVMYGILYLAFAYLINGQSAAPPAPPSGTPPGPPAAPPGLADPAPSPPPPPASSLQPLLPATPAPAPPAPPGPLPPPPAATPATPLQPAGRCGLPWLQLNLSSGSDIVCKGTQTLRPDRYWAAQTPGLDQAEVVVFPNTAEDVAAILKVVSEKMDSAYDWTFVSGGHSCVGASTASGMIIDLSRLNNVQVDKSKGLVTYGPGANWKAINAVTAGSGYVAIGARVDSVGGGGFSTGGGIGFLGGAYGYAIDRLQTLQVALMDGRLVTAESTGQFSDLFWALQGGNGQFGIVTKFTVRAVPEPSQAEVGYYWIPANQTSIARENVVAFFNGNKDPHSLVYWVRGFIPPSLVDTDPTHIGLNEVLVALRFGDPKTPSQPTYDSTFSTLLKGLSPSFQLVMNMKYEETSAGVTAFFPEGFRRLFEGPVVSTISKSYLDKLATRMDQYINESLAKGDPPASAIYALQYMYPGLNGNLPKSDAATAWPHSSASGHQTLFSPAWSNPANDLFVKTAGADLNKISYDYQRATGKFPRDYPNYWSAKDPNTQESSKNSGWNGSRYFGANLPRLVQIKEKYDPECLIRKGPTFASAACKRMRYASIF